MVWDIVEYCQCFVCIFPFGTFGVTFPKRFYAIPSVSFPHRIFFAWISLSLFLSLSLCLWLSQWRLKFIPWARFFLSFSQSRCMAVYLCAIHSTCRKLFAPEHVRRYKRFIFVDSVEQQQPKQKLNYILDSSAQKYPSENVPWYNQRSLFKNLDAITPFSFPNWHFSLYRLYSKANKTANTINIGDENVFECVCMRIECGANERRRNEQMNANNSLAGSFTPFPSLFHPLQRVEISFRVGFPLAPDFKLDLCWCMLNRHHADERCSVSYCSRHYFYSQIDTQNRFNHCRHVKSNANNSDDVCERESKPKSEPKW